MAIQASKRRKLEHDSSDKEDDASFASLGDDHDDEIDGSEEDAVAGDQGEDPTDDEESENEEDGGVDAEEEASGDRDEEKPTGVNKSASKQLSSTRSRSSQHQPIDASGGMYSAGTFKSNMFKLQVDELLAQIRPKRGKREESAEQALHTLKKTIEQADAVAAMSIDEAERKTLTNKVAIPFPDPRPPKDAQYKLEYAKPANINVVGSFALKTSLRARDVLEVDMTVAMPASLFQEKDYLNYRYFYRRAYYLACIAVAIEQAHHAEFDVRYEDFRDDHLKPIIVVLPRQAKASDGEAKPAPKWRINILPCVGADVFPPDRLLPNRNCVRPAAEVKAEATPFYNASLRADMLMTQYLKLIHSAASTCSAFRDACLLGTTWLRQRGLSCSISVGGFGSFEWATLMALLLQGGGPNGKPVLSEGYSSYQLFKATLQMLAMKDMSKQAVVVGQAPGDVRAAAAGLPMFWDGLRSHNILYKMQTWSYLELRREARTTLEMLGDQLYDGFDAAFILRLDNPLLRCDQMIELSSAAVPDERKLYEALKRGLGDRISHISILAPSSQPWQLGAARPKAASQPAYQIGFVINLDAINRTVDHGPAAESKSDAASFRKFWGEKAELRRFKDGSILESLIWAPNESGQSVLEQVVRFVVKRHVSDAAEASATFKGDGFAKMLGRSSGNAVFQPMMESFKQLESDVRGLDDLPLSIRQFMPADAQLRYASMEPPASVPGKQRSLPADVTIQFEGSARWPDDLVAIQRTKIAFLLNMHDKMQEAVDGATVRMGLENQDRDVLNQGYLEVIYGSGAAFRLRVQHEREQDLLERQLKDKSLAPSAKEAAAVGLATYKRDYVRKPAHTQAIARLCGRFPALSGTMRLMKKWIASHLLVNHIPEEVIELIVARTFVQPWPWQTPSSVQTGFLRTLHWLSRWDWRAELLLVDLSGSGELKQLEAQAARTRFDAWRKLDPSMNRIVLFAASNVDLDGTTWTDGTPSKVVASRMTALAKAAYSELEEQRLSIEPADLFSSPLNDYDFILHLNPTLASGKKRRSASGAATFKNLELASVDDPALVGFDPTALLLNELSDVYGSAILFFSGAPERPVIAGLWSPQTAARTWKVNLAFSTMPVKAGKAEEIHAHINKDATLAEIARLGGDLIEKVESIR